MRSVFAFVVIGLIAEFILFPTLGLPFSWGAYCAGFLVGIFIQASRQASKQESGFSADWIEDFHNKGDKV